MCVKIGDKVRFLNSVGGGIVRSIAKNGHIMVETEDGFDIPSLARELVVVESLDSQKQAFKTKAPEVQKMVQPVKQEAPPKPVVIKETPEGEVLNVFLAFIPDNPKLVDTVYETYLINESNFFLYYNYMYRQNNSWISRNNGLIEPNTKIFMEEFGKDSINSLERICVQLIAFKKDKPFKQKKPVSAELRIDVVKFYKMHCFVPNDYFDEDALLYPVVRSDAPEVELLINPSEIQEAINQKKHADSNTSKKVPKKKEEREIIEVDLHINQLLDSTKGMSNFEILTYQLDVFHRIMSQNLKQTGQKIIFIHGKGDGVLRASIEKELKQNYKSCTFQDASFQEYGFGATLVTIR